MTPVLWGRPSSVNVQKVLWALDELGLAFDHRIVAGKYGGMDAVGALSPVPRVPIFEDGGVAIWESHAILRYLARRSGWVLGPTEFARAETWLDFATSTVQPAFITVFWQKVRLPMADRDSAALAAAVDRLRGGLAALETGLERQAGRYLAGSEFTIADIGMGTMMFRLFDILPELGGCFANIDAWRRLLERRNAWQRRVATSYDELKAPDYRD